MHSVMSSPKHSFYSSSTKDERPLKKSPLDLPADSHLRHAEKAFTDYLLKNVAPTEESEKRREAIFLKLKSII
jgi:hypothetical protein